MQSALFREHLTRLRETRQKLYDVEKKVEIQVLLKVHKFKLELAQKPHHLWVNRRPDGVRFIQINFRSLIEHYYARCVDAISKEISSENPF